MDSSFFKCCSPIISIFVCFLFFVFFCCPVYSLEPVTSDHINQTFHPRIESEKLRMIRDHLMKINKPAIKTIQSPDGDIIDCVLSHLQPAFDHPQLKGQKPLDPPERSKGHNSTSDLLENFQLWNIGGESCPEGTIPIRRTKKEDILRASSIRRFGTKIQRPVRRDSYDAHEHSIGYSDGQQFYGAKAGINIWAPKIASPKEFSLSQIWVMGGSFDTDFNTIESGWQVYPKLYGDYNPRLFTYWTRDAYHGTGCYNLLCSGFIQTNNRIALGAAITPVSSYNGVQFDITLLIWKEPKSGNWWLQYGEGVRVGYWPSFLFTHLEHSADRVEFGGEIVNEGSSSHTSTEMGSGHFASEGYGKASYFRNLQVVDVDNNLKPVSDFKLNAEHKNCYDIQQYVNKDWGNYFYYGGPGRNSKCP